MLTIQGVNEPRFHFSSSRSPPEWVMFWRGLRRRHLVLMEVRSIDYWKTKCGRHWQNTIERTGTAELEIGGFRILTFVVENTSVNLGNGWTGKAVYHYSPALGYVVRSEKTRSDKRDRKVWQLKSVVELNR